MNNLESALKELGVSPKTCLAEMIAAKVYQPKKHIMYAYEEVAERHSTGKYATLKRVQKEIAELWKNPTRTTQLIMGTYIETNPPTNKIFIETAARYVIDKSQK